MWLPYKATKIGKPVLIRTCCNQFQRVLNQLKPEDKQKIMNWQIKLSGIHEKLCENSRCTWNLTCQNPMVTNGKEMWGDYFFRNKSPPPDLTSLYLDSIGSSQVRLVSVRLRDLTTIFKSSYFLIAFQSNSTRTLRLNTLSVGIDNCAIGIWQQ